MNQENKDMVNAIKEDQVQKKLDKIQSVLLEEHTKPTVKLNKILAILNEK